MDYKKARDESWRTLIKHNVKQLPVDVVQICKDERIPIFTYRSGKNFIKEMGLEEHIIDNDAFSICGIIFYDDTKPIRRQRFSIAHELGHIILHTRNSDRILCRDSKNYGSMEAEANIFAARLLAPLCVLQFLDLNSAKEIYDLCNISYCSAKLRFARLCEIRKRSSIRRREKKHGTFLISKLERQIVENFKEYIYENRRGNAACSQSEIQAPISSDVEFINSNTQKSNDYF